MAGNSSRLTDPDFVKLVAEGFSNGLSRAEMAEMFSVSKGTITTWRRDPRVRVQTLKLIEDRVVRITSKVDAIIGHRLQYADDIDTETLIKIRKEYLGGALRTASEGKGADAETINEAMNEIEADPERLKELTELLGRSAAKAAK